jgi:hypothetical protein
MPDLFETYRGVEIFAQHVPVATGDRPRLTVEYSCTVAGQTIRDRSVYRLKIEIDKRLDSQRA